MATLLTPAKLATALGETASTTVADDVPVFAIDDTVFWRNDMPDDGSNLPIPSIKYKVLDAQHKFLDIAGATEVVDQLNLAAVGDGIVTRAVAGFDHVAGISGAEVNPTFSRPWYHDIQNLSTLVIHRKIHATQLTNLAGWEAFVAAKAPDIIA